MSSTPRSSKCSSTYGFPRLKFSTKFLSLSFVLRVLPSHRSWFIHNQLSVTDVRNVHCSANHLWMRYVVYTHTRTELYNFSVEETYLYWFWYSWGSYLVVSYLRDLGLSPGWSLCYLRWTEWLWGMSFSNHLSAYHSTDNLYLLSELVE